MRKLYKKGLVYNWGINDSPVAVQPLIDGKQVMCPYYDRWMNMLRRTFKQEYKEKHPTYLDGSVCEEWRYFTVFKAWMEKQNWEGLDLDKDILIKGNKTYSPDACCFVPPRINKLLNIRHNSRGATPIGVHAFYNKFKSFLREDGENLYLGMYRDEQEAHKAWQWAKAAAIEKAIHWYAKQSCFRTDVAEALTKRVWQLRLDHCLNRETKEI